MPYRLFVSTGEVSGDLQGSLLVSALNRQAAARGLDLEIVGLGGDRMARAGATLLGNTTAISSIGLWEAIPYIWPTWRMQQRVKRFLRRNPPDGVVLIDYMGPNISWGNLLRRQSKRLPIIYYIAPQEWVWSFGDGNTTQMVGFSDLIQAVFPSEARYYAAKGANVSWVGHPLLDLLAERPSREQARHELGLADHTRAIALFPASRQQELKYLMPAMFMAARRLQDELADVEFLIPLSQPRFRAQVAAAVRQYGLNARILEDRNITVQAAADLAIAKSGTVNLELALQRVPQVVIYRVGRVTAWVAQHILRFSIPFMSPPNLITMEAVVPELLQDEASAERIYREAFPLLTDSHRIEQLQAGYQRMREALGEPGVCDRAANGILDLMLERATPADS